ncbi:chemotaxis protein CheW [Haloarcula laminariae]|uniref:chemotaxis protein CheW n=1 Tax=Haloarcula laminariae TaxID=2961577 RepID=UPI0021C82A65|nr:chemotaxis protein CheW [Halomicroarcula laminariae]
MSDDRMDRAERISNMRSGSRGTDDGTDEDDSAATDDDETGDDADRSSTENDETPATGDGGDESAAPAEDAESGPTDTDAADDTVTESDAQAAAQRAAQSAAEVMGGGADGATAATEGGDAGGETAAGETPAATGASTVPGDISGVELPDQQLLEEAMAASSVESTEGGARAAMEGETTQSEEVVRVLEFALGDEYYCLDIEYVEEIVKRDAVTRVPNTPAFVDGVVDLRGQITTILEPKEMMDIEGEGDQNLIIVFDPDQFEDQGAIGWVVDEVRQVVPVPESDINHPPVDAEYINGVVDREEYDQFVIWVEPEDALAQATASEDE